MTQTRTPTAVSAFPNICPEAPDVTLLLEQHGFRLIFHLNAVPARLYNGTPALPAQYHYQDHHGAEVIYLAGQDISEDHTQPFPLHASRWWIYPGANEQATNAVMHALSVRWFIQWTDSD